MRPVPWSEADADSASFLAIVPPRPIAEAIRRAEARFEISPAVPPHVTVKAQPGLQDPTLWREPVRQLLVSIDPIAMKLGPPRWFGTDLLYLSIEGHGVVDLHRRILECLEAAGVEECFEYEGDEYVPHLTIGAPWATADGISGGLDELPVHLEQLPSEPFVVTEVIEIRRSKADGAYSEAHRFSLRPG